MSDWWNMTGTFDPNWGLQLHQLGLVALAGLLGGVLGLEREFAGKPAGLRTHIFIAAAACLFMVLGRTMIVGFTAQGAEGIDADPIRVMQAVLVGISFLGAGTIIEHRGARIEGLTTAASMLVIAGIGIAVAIGQLVLAVSVTLLALLVLVVLGWIEKRVGPDQRDRPHERR